MEESNSRKHKINSTAYDLAPKAEVAYKEVSIDNLDTNNFRVGLESQDLNQKINLLIHQTRALRQDNIKKEANLEACKKDIRDIGKKIDLLVGELITNKVYSFRHQEYNQIMIGYTGNFEYRRKRHEANGWILLGQKPGNQQKDEKRIKELIKSVGIKPLPGTHEQYEITPQLIALLVADDWVGIKENKDKLLQKDSQLGLVFQTH